MLDIRVDDLDPIAKTPFKTYLSVLHDVTWPGLLATWQGLFIIPGIDLGTICQGCAHIMPGLLGLQKLYLQYCLQTGSLQQVCAGVTEI